MESQKTWHVTLSSEPIPVQCLPAGHPYIPFGASSAPHWNGCCSQFRVIHWKKDTGRFDCAGISARVQQRHLQTLVLVEKHGKWMQAALFGTCWTKARQLWAEVFCRTTFPKWLSRYDFTLTFQLVHETLANATQVPLVFVQSLMTCSPKHFLWFFVCFIFVNFSSLRQLFIGFRFRFLWG